MRWLIFLLQNNSYLSCFRCSLNFDEKFNREYGRISILKMKAGLSKVLSRARVDSPRVSLHCENLSWTEEEPAPPPPRPFLPTPLLAPSPSPRLHNTPRSGLLDVCAIPAEALFFIITSQNFDENPMAGQWKADERGGGLSLHCELGCTDTERWGKFSPFPSLLHVRYLVIDMASPVETAYTKKVQCMKC